MNQDRHAVHKAALLPMRQALYDFDPVPVKAALTAVFQPDAIVHLACPFEDLDGASALFGEARTDGRQVSNELQAALTQDKVQGQSVPQVSVLDLLEDISAASPSSNASGPARLDVIELHIRPKKTDLKATCASAQYVDDLAANLGKIPCFRKVQKGKVLTLKNTVEVKQFALEIETTCP